MRSLRLTPLEMTMIIWLRFLRSLRSVEMTIIILKYSMFQARFPCAERPNLLRSAGSPRVNCPDYIIEGPYKSGQEGLAPQSHENFRPRPGRKFCEPVHLGFREARQGERPTLLPLINPWRCEQYKELAERHHLPPPCSSRVQRSKQDKEREHLRRGAYTEVRDPEESGVRHSIAQLI